MNIFNDSISNKKNKFIMDEFIKYYEYIYANQDILNKQSNEIYYKLMNIKKIITIIKNYKNDIDLNELEKINKIKGVGIKSINRIKEILETGKLSEIQILQKKQDAVNELTKIYGIGPKKAIDLYNKNITTIQELIDSKHELTYPQKISIQYYKNTCDKIPRIDILKLEIWLHEIFIKKDNNYIVIICGSYRRGKDFSKDIDILITHKNLLHLKECDKILVEAINILKKNNYLVDDLQLHGKNHYQGYAKIDKMSDDKNFKLNVVRTDIIVVPIDCLFTALMHFTGSALFNEKIRGIAKSKSLKLNEYGLFKNNKPFKINSENDIFVKLNIPYVAPENRN
jgi:DNA polymerase/3'-5' exonuclease PolX